jgi:hypothetical protein
VAQQRVETADARVGSAPRLFMQVPNDLVTTDLMEMKAVALGPARQRPRRRWQVGQGRLREANSSDDSAGGGTTSDGPMLTTYEVTDGEMTMMDQDTADECLETKQDTNLFLDMIIPSRKGYIGGERHIIICIIRRRVKFKCSSVARRVKQVSGPYAEPTEVKYQDEPCTAAEENTVDSQASKPAYAVTFKGVARSFTPIHTSGLEGTTTVIWLAVWGTAPRPKRL